jgi:hypothetical protein
VGVDITTPYFWTQQKKKEQKPRSQPIASEQTGDIF